MQGEFDDDKTVKMVYSDEDGGSRSSTSRGSQRNINGYHLCITKIKGQLAVCDCTEWPSLSVCHITLYNTYCIYTDKPRHGLWACCIYTDIPRGPGCAKEMSWKCLLCHISRLFPVMPHFQSLTQAGPNWGHLDDLDLLLMKTPLSHCNSFYMRLWQDNTPENSVPDRAKGDLSFTLHPWVPPGISAEKTQFRCTKTRCRKRLYQWRYLSKHF